MEFLRFFTAPVSKFILISSSVPLKVSTVTHQNVVWHVWLTSCKFQKLMIKVLMYLYVTVTVHDFPYIACRRVNFKNVFMHTAIN
jgi:hypothetical protein